MIYANEHHIRLIGIDWASIVDVIRDSVKIIDNQDFAQPIKLYLRYDSMANRIISMPAYIGGKISFSGVKWIASFPSNLEQGLPRAHSVTILNKAETGQPVCIFNTSLISGIRTAGVSGYVLTEFVNRRPDLEKISVGIIGHGPIGKLHIEMLTTILGDRIDRWMLYDVREIERNGVAENIRSKVQVVDSWKPILEAADILITATTSQKAYINGTPKKGSLHLNVSLRDYTPDFIDYADVILVDSWDEVCRENTDIEHMHLKKGLTKNDVCEIQSFHSNHPLTNLKASDVVFFNPMGMAVFDVAVGAYYFNKAKQSGMGIELP